MVLFVDEKVWDSLRLEYEERPHISGKRASFNTVCVCVLCRDREERLAALSAAQQEAMEELQKKIQMKATCFLPFQQCYFYSGRNPASVRGSDAYCSSSLFLRTPPTA